MLVMYSSILNPLEAHKKQNESKTSQQNEQKTLLQMGGRGERDGARYRWCCDILL